MFETIIIWIVIYFVGVGYAYAILDNDDKDLLANGLISICSWLVVFVAAGIWIGNRAVKEFKNKDY